MEKDIAITEDELLLVMTSLFLTIQTHKKYKMNHDKDDLDIESKQVLADCEQLFERLNKDYLSFS